MFSPKTVKNTHIFFLKIAGGGGGGWGVLASHTWASSEVECAARTKIFLLIYTFVIMHILYTYPPASTKLGLSEIEEARPLNPKFSTPSGRHRVLCSLLLQRFRSLLADCHEGCVYSVYSLFLSYRVLGIRGVALRAQGNATKAYQGWLA